MKHSLKFKCLFVLLITIFIINTSHSQQEILLTKYTYNSLFFNPAYAGSHGESIGTANVQYRNQWRVVDTRDLFRARGSHTQARAARCGSERIVVLEAKRLREQNEVEVGDTRG